MTEPNGCRWCGLPKGTHYRQWNKAAGWHGHVEPTDQQRLQRMRDRAESRKMMATKGQVRPYRVSFTYPASERCPDGIRAKHVFDTPEQAHSEAQSVAQRGGTARVTREVPGSVQDVAVYHAWTPEQQELAELAALVCDLGDVEDADVLRRQAMALSRKLRSLAVTRINVERF